MGRASSRSGRDAAEAAPGRGWGGVRSAGASPGLCVSVYRFDEGAALRVTVLSEVIGTPISWQTRNRPRARDSHLPALRSAFRPPHPTGGGIALPPGRCGLPTPQPCSPHRRRRTAPRTSSDAPGSPRGRPCDLCRTRFRVRVRDPLDHALSGRLERGSEAPSPSRRGACVVTPPAGGGDKSVLIPASRHGLRHDAAAAIRGGARDGARRLPPSSPPAAP